MVAAVHYILFRMFRGLPENQLSDVYLIVIHLENYLRNFIVNNIVVSFLYIKEKKYIKVSSAIDVINMFA